MRILTKVFFLLVLAFFLSLNIVFYFFKLSLFQAQLLFFFSLFLYLLLLFKHRDNLFVFIRVFLLGFIGLLIFFTVVFTGGYFTVHMKDSQTFDIALLALILTNVALIGSELGFYFASKINFKKIPYKYKPSKTLFYIILILVIFMGLVMSYAYGDLIFLAAYGSGVGSNNVGLGNLNSIANILFLILILVYFRNNNYYKSKKYVLLILVSGLFLFIYAQLLRGVRMDVLNALIGIMIVTQIYRGKNIKIKAYQLIILGVLFVLFQVMGMLRASWGLVSLQDVFLYLKAMIFFEKGNIFTIVGTFNDIAATFSGIIFFIKENIVNFMSGQSYFDFILRTPPEFLYPNRPVDLAWIFKSKGYTSGGGFFELAEAYLNFGIVGCFIIPAIISFIYLYSFKLFLSNPLSIKKSILFFSILAGLYRGLLYQTFTFYKATITGLILMFIIGIIIHFIRIYSRINMRESTLETTN